MIDDSRVALVTGAGRRVGQAIAVALGERGLHVAVHYHQSEGGARETAQWINNTGKSNATLFRADLSDPAVPEQLISDVVAQCGRLDVLVNSAAIMMRTPVDTVDVAQW